MFNLLRRLGALAFALLVAVLVLLIIQPVAFAQEATETVSIPYGAWIETSAGAVATFILAVIGWLMRKLPASVVDILKTMKAEQLLAKAVDYGINAVAGATKGKTLTVNVGNAVVANAVQYAVDNAPGWLVKWLGGPEAIAAKIIARLNLEEAAAVTTSMGGKPILVKAG
jgi:hypothetical protein